MNSEHLDEIINVEYYGSQCRFRSKMNSELQRRSGQNFCTDDVSMPLPQQDEFGEGF